VGLESDGSGGILGDMDRWQVVRVYVGGGCKACGGGGMKGPCSVERESLRGCGLEKTGQEVRAMSFVRHRVHGNTLSVSECNKVGGIYILGGRWDASERLLHGCPGRGLGGMGDGLSEHGGAV